MSTITIQQLTFNYDQQTKPIFDHVTLSLDTDWKLALVGRNGYGKTTFLRLLLGELAYRGHIQIPEKCHYFPQTITEPTQPVKSLISKSSDFDAWQVERELEKLQVKASIFDQPFSSLSGGEQTKVLLACLFANTTDFALIDEPTNHLDLDSRKLITHYLKNKRQGFIVTSHDRHFLNQVSNHVCAIERQQICLYQGNFAVYEQEKKARDQFELEKNENLKRDIQRLKKSSREKMMWSRSREKDKYGDPHQKGSGAVFNTGFIGARAARLMKKAKVVEKRMTSEISEKQRLLKNIETTVPLELRYQPDYHKTLLTLTDLSLSYDHQPLFAPIRLRMTHGERIALTGRNGVGKSSLLQAIQNRFSGQRIGQINLSTTVQVSLVRQQYHDNRGSLRSFAKMRKIDYPLFLNNLHKLGMSCDVFETPIQAMSMGQQKKVELAASLATPANLYLWDEPLNYLDVFNQKQLEQLLLSSQASLLFVEHDQTFIDHIATRTIHLTPYS